MFQTHASQNSLACHASTISVSSTFQLRSNYNNRHPACSRTEQASCTCVQTVPKSIHTVRDHEGWCKLLVDIDAERLCIRVRQCGQQRSVANVQVQFRLVKQTVSSVCAFNHDDSKCMQHLLQLLMCYGIFPAVSLATLMHTD